MPAVEFAYEVPSVWLRPCELTLSDLKPGALHGIQVREGSLIPGGRASGVWGWNVPGAPAPPPRSRTLISPSRSCPWPWRQRLSVVRLACGALAGSRMCSPQSQLPGPAPWLVSEPPCPLPRRSRRPSLGRPAPSFSLGLAPTPAVASIGFQVGLTSTVVPYWEDRG